MKTNDSLKKIEPEFRIRRKSLRRIPRKHRAIAEEIQPRNCKVRVTIYLDADIVEHFKGAAARPNSAAYQTQINNALRSVLRSGSESIAYDNLLNDDRFIAAVARRVQRSGVRRA